MKICAISDMHNHLDSIKVPDCDILIIAGDVTSRGTIAEMSKFNFQLEKIKKNVKSIVMIGGNHDICLEENPYLSKSMLTNVDFYLENSSAEVMGLKFWGSPWTQRFFDWAFNADPDKLIEVWSQIPEGLDFLVTHGPPHGIMDETEEGVNVGCKILLHEIQTRAKPKYHIYGHIHEGYGTKVVDGITFINASSCNRKYQPVNPPIVMEIP
jgi:Icc-related predicted phosphoesterase